VSHAIASGRSACALALGKNALARDVAALSRPNGSSRLVVNNPCGSRVDGSEGVWGIVSLGAIGWRSLPRLAILVTIPERGTDGPLTGGPSCSTRGGDRAAATGQR